jgi:hypothetical protein
MRRESLQEQTNAQEKSHVKGQSLVSLAWHQGVLASLLLH